MLKNEASRCVCVVREQNVLASLGVCTVVEGGDKETKREMFLPNKRALAETKPNKLKHHQMRTGSRKV